MRIIRYVIWRNDIEDKLLWKHNVTADEVEEVLWSKPRILFKEKADVEGEDLYNKSCNQLCRNTIHEPLLARIRAAERLRVSSLQGV